jgi:hypothetical protein
LGGAKEKTVSTVFSGDVFHPTVKPLKRLSMGAPLLTGLKPGVNEKNRLFKNSVRRARFGIR